ncbi:hypothetical protein ACJX0J_027829, partial [Zea mays]
SESGAPASRLAVSSSSSCTSIPRLPSCASSAPTKATATAGGGDEAEAAGGPLGWPDPVLRPQAGAGAVCDGPSHRVADALHGVSFFCWDSLGKRRRAFSHVLGIDIDPQSLELAQENAADLELDIDLVWSDIKNLNLKGVHVDTVVMNPPFGTRRNGADMEFLSMALQEDIMFHSSATEVRGKLGVVLIVPGLSGTVAMEAQIFSRIHTSMRILEPTIMTQIRNQFPRFSLSFISIDNTSFFFHKKIDLLWDASRTRLNYYNMIGYYPDIDESIVAYPL